MLVLRSHINGLCGDTISSHADLFAAFTIIHSFVGFAFKPGATLCSLFVALKPG